MVLTLEDFAKKLVGLGIDEGIAKRLIEEYRDVKKAHFFNKYEEVIKYAGKFSETILALIENKVSGKSINLDKVEFDELYKKIVKYPKSSAKEEVLTLAIPRVARSVYTLRSKKDVVHVKTVDPDFIDSVYCLTACDWMLSEIALLFLKVDEREVYELINSVLKKKIPLVEEFEDGTIVILKKDLSRSDEILLTLYYHYPRRLPNSDLDKILKLPSKSIYVYLQRLEDERLIHRTEEGSKLTQLGIKYVEENLLKDKV
jgi:DNA-binding PadR family transcriptional regulator